MGTFRETVKYQNGYEEKKLTRSGKAVAWLAAAAIGFGVMSDKGLDGFQALKDTVGHGTTFRTTTDMDKEAQTKYKRVLAQASPSQLFELRYTDFAHIRVARTAIHSEGIIGFFASDGGNSYNDGQHYDIGDGCLNDTAFDINGGSLHFNVELHGLLSTVDASASGDFPTAAAQASYQSSTNELTIRTGNAHPDDLNFALHGTLLRPSDQYTKDLLATYGCASAVKTTTYEGR